MQRILAQNPARFILITETWATSTISYSIPIRAQSGGRFNDNSERCLVTNIKELSR
jgi:hypothetical protein